MKQITKKQKIVMAIIAVVIIAGIIVTLTLGLNFDLKFQDTNKVELYIAKEFDIADIKAITDETLENQPVVIQKVEVYEDSVSIIAKEITEEQKQNLVEKINEKYETELSAEDIEIQSIPHTRGRDLLKAYILPFSIATVIILVYMAIRYIKLGALKTVVNTVVILVVAQAILLSIIAIARIPVGRLTMPMVITVYLLTLVGLTTRYEKELTTKKEEEKK